MERAPVPVPSALSSAVAACKIYIGAVWCHMNYEKPLSPPKERTGGGRAGVFWQQMGRPGRLKERWMAVGADDSSYEHAIAASSSPHLHCHAP